MQRALELAKRGVGKTSPNPMVGAVIVKNKRIIAEGWHPYCGADHAEMIALKKAGDKARGARLYLTLEPCHHFGLTPPCVDAVIKSGVREVVIAMKDPNPLTNGKSIAKLKRAGIKVSVGLLEKEVRRLNEAFIKYIMTKMPFVVAKTAQTLDGKIATATGDSQWITSEETRAFAHLMRDEFDAICVGINTVLRDDPELNGVKKKILKKIVIDSQLRTPLSARFLKKRYLGQCIMATTKDASPKKIKDFKKRGIYVLICPKTKAGVDLKWLFKELAKIKIMSILIEGGATVIGSALKVNLVDKMHIYLAPKILGDQNALSSIQGLNIKKIHQTINFSELTVKKSHQDILITGYVHRHR